MGTRGQGIGRWCGLGVCLGLLLLLWPGGCGQKPSAAPVASAGRPMVRVRVMDRMSQVDLTATSPPTVQSPGGPPQKLELPRGKVPVTLTSAGWRVGPFTLGPGELIIAPNPEGTVTVDGVAHRGTYRLVPAAGGTFDVVNHVDIESYLKGVLARELYAEFEPEAYKAQAIAARTYALYEARTAPAGRAWDLQADTRSQMYGGIKGESRKSVAATEETAGVVLAYGPPGQERIFKAYYSSCCGGATQSAKEAFSEPPFEPFTDQRNGNRCDVAAGKYHARFNWGPVVVPKDELTRRFRAFGQARGRPERNMATVQRIDVFQANPSGRPTKFTVVDARNVQYLISGEDLRLAVNTDASPGSTLLSSYVTPVALTSAIRFQNGHGHGHGVGLCQWCAHAQAVAGARHEGIVLGAYKGAKLVRAY